jgi:hypothetical protein
VVALVSTSALNLEVKVDYSWDEIFERLKLKPLQSALAGGKGQTVRVMQELGYWQAGMIDVETVR